MFAFALAVVLALFAFVGGGTVMYFVMEEPRRRARRELAALTAERVEVGEQMEYVEAARRRVADREQALADTAAAHGWRERDLADRTAAFERRVIGYDDLAAENRLLKVDLKNVAVQAAHRDCLHDTLQQELAAASGQLDRLGRELFEEMRAAARRATTASNYPTQKERVRAAAARVRAAGVRLAKADEDQALADLHTQFEKAVRAGVEREEQARLREQIREDQRRERQAQEEVERADRERRAIEVALQRALTDAAGKHAAEVDRLRAQLAEAEAKSRRAISMAEITRSGYVYVISNPGSFGRDVFKIGMTRRQEPMDRVHELGDASVPFPFDVHMMICCDDAPKLESALHRAFTRRRVNRVNLRKEFFRVTIDEIVAAVRENHGEVAYTADPEALEFLASQQTTDADLDEAEQVYETAEAAVGGATAEGD